MTTTKSAGSLNLTTPSDREIVLRRGAFRFVWRRDTDATTDMGITAALGPSWYPIVLVLTALPCAWLSGALHRTQQAEA